MSVVVMSRNGSEPQSICGDPQCRGPFCQVCHAFRESAVIHESIQCPEKIPSCSARDPCDICKATANSLVETRDGGAVGGGKASDVVPLQPVHDLTKCSYCGKTLGSNTQNCAICASVAELPTNPAQPNIKYNSEFGPMENSFGPCADATTERTLNSFRMSFEI